MSGLGINTNLLLFQIVNFLVVLFLLRLFLVKPMMSLFERRRASIRESLAEAERVKEEAAAERERLEAQLAEERRTSQERLRDAVAKSEEAAGRRLAEANAEAADIVGKAREEANATRDNALAGLQGEIADLALRAAAKVLQDGVDEARHRALVDKFLRDELGDLA